jgi:hypothetical protein
MFLLMISNAFFYKNGDKFNWTIHMITNVKGDVEKIQLLSMGFHGKWVCFTK